MPPPIPPLVAPKGMSSAKTPWQRYVERRGPLRPRAPSPTPTLEADEPSPTLEADEPSPTHSPTRSPALENPWQRRQRRRVEDLARLPSPTSPLRSHSEEYDPFDDAQTRAFIRRAAARSPSRSSHSDEYDPFEDVGARASRTLYHEARIPLEREASASDGSDTEPPSPVDIPLRT
jgi:hypothetical protein